MSVTSEPEPITVIVDQSLRIKVEPETTLTKAELEERLMRFEDNPWGWLPFSGEVIFGSTVYRDDGLPAVSAAAYVPAR